MEEPGQEAEDDFIFNEYAIDDTLDPLSRLVKYHTSDFSLQRLVLIRELTDTAEFAGYAETTAKLIPLLSTFVADSEPVVRQMLVQQLQPLGEFIVNHGGEAGYQELLNQLLPFTFELLVDKNVEVGNAAMQTLIKLADLVRAPQVEAQLLHVVVTLAHDERAEDYRVAAAQLFNDLAPKFGEQLCIESVLPEVKMLSDDMSFSVRKTVGSFLGTICKVVGPAVAVDKILPIYLALCKDEIWGVRKACAESLVQVSEGVTPEARVSQLVPAFKGLSEDASRWVRVAAYQNLGQFLNTMQPKDISTLFLKIFTDMAFQSEGGDADFAEYCAFSFPAVAAVIGRDRWRELDDAFATLLKDVQWKVRKSLAYSLHEIAKIVGRDIAEKSLTQAFELFLRDLDEVKLGVITNSPEFLEVLGPASRVKFVSLICAVPQESENWRLRNLVAQKLGHLAKLVTPAVASGCVAELAMKLLDDSVCEVKASTYHSVALILLHLQGDPGYDSFLQYVSTLATKNSYQMRQVFCYVVQQLMELGATQVVEKELLDKFIALGDDNVPNVRFVVARVIAMTCSNNAFWKSHAKIVGATKKLNEDKKTDVVQMIQTPLPKVKDVAMAAAYRPF